MEKNTNPWNDVKTTIKTNIDIPDSCMILTERQWAKRGYLKNDENCGKMLWSNRNANGKKYLYLWNSEVRKATDEEIKDYFAPERQRKAGYRIKAREKKQKEQEQLELRMLSMENQIKVLQEQLDRATRMICQYNVSYEMHNTAIVIDTETTGLIAGCDELLQVSIINVDGETLLNSYIKPLFHDTWKEAERVNGISQSMVKNAPTIIEICADIQKIISQAKVIIGYNTDFDLGFLENTGIIIPDNAEIIDVMKDFAEIYGEYSDFYEAYKWQKLSTCANYFDYDWGNDKAHDSLSDCKATLYCYKKIRNIKENINGL